MEEQFDAADQRIMESTIVRVRARQEKASQGAGSRVAEMPLWKIRASRRAQPALAVFGD